MEEYIRDVIFKDDEELYKNLRELSESIQEVKLNKKPFLIEFMGSCRSGKTSSIELIQDVLVKNGLRVLVIDEEYVSLTKEINNSRAKKMSINSLEYTNNIIEEKISIFDETCNQSYDIIIYDRGINDEFVWLNSFGGSSEDLARYDQKLEKRQVNLLVIMICSTEKSLERKYRNSLSIMPSKWTNKETMNNYLKGLESANEYFSKHSENIYKINTNEINKVNTALDVCKNIINKCS